MMDDKALAAACFKVMTALQLTPAKLKIQIPVGFWAKVRKELSVNYTPAELRRAFFRNRDRILNLITGLEAELTRKSFKTEDVLDGDPSVVVDIDTVELTAICRDLAEAEKGIRFPENEPEKYLELISLIEDMEKRLLKKIDAGIADALQAYTKRATDDEPPLPGKSGKKFDGEKRDLRARIDSSLMELFDLECRKYRGNASRTMDVILWRYFGRPKMSFEQ